MFVCALLFFSVAKACDYRLLPGEKSLFGALEMLLDVGVRSFRGKLLWFRVGYKGVLR